MREVMPLGKISASVFDRQIAPKLGADRADVTIGPKYGVDFGVLDVDGTALVAATDPISILPDLGFERAGRFALHIVLSDVAVSGLAPSHLTIAFSLPTAITDDEFAAVWDAIDAECRDLGISVCTGHTARYPGASFPWVGAATALAVGEHDDIIRPDGARVGDDLIVTKGPAIEATGLFATLFPEALDLSRSAQQAAEARLSDTQTVRDCSAIAAGPGVTAMHDATEGGLLGALHEVAESAGVGLSVDRDAVPIAPGVEATCSALGIDPWTATSSGTLIVTASPDASEAIVDRLAARGTSAAIVGEVTADSGVQIDGTQTGPPESDSSWAVYESLSGSTASE